MFVITMQDRSNMGFLVAVSAVDYAIGPLANALRYDLRFDAQADLSLLPATVFATIVSFPHGSCPTTEEPAGCEGG